jgi:hypothetical protein
VRDINTSQVFCPEKCDIFTAEIPLLPPLALAMKSYHICIIPPHKSSSYEYYWIEE